MTDYQRAHAGLATLLEIAKDDLTTLKNDLTDIANAQQRIEASLDEVDRQFKSLGAVDIESLRARGANLRTTLLSLERAEEAVGKKFALAKAELSKLTQLMARNDRVQKTGRLAVSSEGSVTHEQGVVATHRASRGQ